MDDNSNQTALLGRYSIDILCLSLSQSVSLCPSECVCRGVFVCQTLSLANEIIGLCQTLLKNTISKMNIIIFFDF